MAISKLIFNGVVQMDVTGDTVTANTLLDGETATGADGEGIVGVYNPPAFTKQTKSVTYTPTNSQQTDSLTPDVGYDGLERVNITINAMPSGTAGTPTATKGAVSDHTITVTPSVTNVAGYISGGTITGTAVSVAASELVSGSQSITVNDTYDVTNLAEVVVNVAGGGGDSWSWAGKNPTVVKTYTDKVYLKDTAYATWTPSTTATTLSSSVNLSTYTGDRDNYDYIVYGRWHSHYEYGAGATGTSEIQEAYSVYATDIFGYASNLSNMTNGTFNSTTTAAAAAMGGGMFYKNTSGVASYTASNSYGVYPPSNPGVGVSTSTLTPRIPQINARCSTSEFTTTSAAAVDLDNSYYEYKIEIIQVDKETSNNGFKNSRIRDMWLNGIS